MNIHFFGDPSTDALKFWSSTWMRIWQI